MLAEIKQNSMVAWKSSMLIEEPLNLEEESMAKMKNCLSPTFAHRKKTRRGKKKSYGRIADVVSRSSPCADAENMSCGCYSSSPYSSSRIEGNVMTTPTRSKVQKKKLRPVYSPKAPHNSTQFLMNDNLENQTLSENLFHHQSEISMYEGDIATSHPCNSSPLYWSSSSGENSPVHATDTCPDDFNASSLVEEEYHSLDDIDSRINFFEQDFETMYSTMRAEELSSKTKQNLVDSVLGLECKLERLDHELNEEVETRKDPTGASTSMLEALLEENRMLKLENDKLREGLSQE